MVEYLDLSNCTSPSSSPFCTMLTPSLSLQVNGRTRTPTLMETDMFRCMALGALGNGLQANDEAEAALPVLEADLALIERYWSRDENAVLIARTNLASCLKGAGRHEEAEARRAEGS